MTPDHNCTRRSVVGLLLGLGLTGCSSLRETKLSIDRSMHATGQDSRVQFIVIHYTALPDEASLHTLIKERVSSHYLITRKPVARILQLVDENRRAWHAGESIWYGRTFLNSASIGIEIVNQGPRENGDWDPYPRDQITLLAALIHDIAQRHNVKAHNIVGHSDIAPQRKQDPGPAFPWEQLAQQGIGRWFDPERAAVLEQHFNETGLPETPLIQQELQRVGYTTPRSGLLDTETRNVIRAFQMHYRPQRCDGTPDAQTLARLKALS